jgi:subtilisin-like proprotein convertase family protein
MINKIQHNKPTILKALAVFVIVCCCFWQNAFSQAPNAYSFSQGSTTYAAISGTTSTAAGDDGTESNIPIGFTFNYNNAAHTTVSVTTNGSIRIGNTAPGAWWGNSLQSFSTNIIGVLWDDNDATGGNIQYLTSGTAPNRTFTIQWTNVHIGGTGSSTNPTANFQVVLHETSNLIQFIYGSTSAAFVSTSASIGINGATGNFISVTPASPNATFSISTANNGISAATDFPSGTVYNFTPPPSCLTAISATTSPSSFVVCAGATVTINATGALNDVGSTNQWKFSTTSGGPYSNVAGGTGATTASYTSGALSAGTYYYVLENTCANCGPCSLLSSETVVTVNALPSISVTPSAASVCNPGSPSVSLAASGGISYTWAPAATLNSSTLATVTATPITTTTYTVTGTDANNCTATATASITYNAGVNLTSVTASPASVCSGANSVLTANTVSPTYTYCPTTHSSGCSGDDITLVVLNTLNNPTSGCGGASRYTYFTGGGAQTTSLTANNTYSLDVSFGSDGNQYFGAWIDYNQNGALEASEFLGASANAGSNGTISVAFTVPIGAINGVTRLRIVGGNDSPVTASQACGASSSGFGESQDYNLTISGGAEYYTYSWAPATYLSSTTSNPTTAVAVLTNETYTVTVSAPNGCTLTGTASITAGSPLNCGAIQGQANYCTGSSFNLSINPSGGGAPYSYLWSDGATTSSITQNLLAGTYTVTVTVTDACAATCSASLTYTVYDTPTASITQTGPITVCSNDLPTILNATTSAVTPTYVWKKDGTAIIPAETNASLNANLSGSYSVVVSENGCSAESVPTVVNVVASTAPPTPSPTSIAVCQGAATSPSFTSECNVMGSKTVSESGATGLPITWTSTVTGATASTVVSSFPASSVITNVTVTLNLRHTWGGDMVIFLQAPNGGPSVGILNNAGVDPNLDYGTASGSGVTLPYTFSTGSASLPLSGAVASPGPYAPQGNFTLFNGFDPNGTWTVTVSDGVGGDGGSLDGVVINITADTSGIMASNWYDAPTGGTFLGAYSNFNPITDGGVNTSNAGTTTFYSSCPGVSGCPSVRVPLSFVVNAPPVVACSGDSVSCNGGSDGMASVNATGSGPFTYLWSNGGTTSSITGLSIGNYCVTVTDANGCTSTCCYLVEQPAAALSATATATPSSCPICTDGSLTISSVSGGTLPYSYTNLTNVASGFYCITVTDANGCTTSACGTVTALGCTLSVATTINSHVTCFGTNTGSASVAPQGNITGPYTYLWTDGTTTAANNTLVAGTHTITINDQGTGCVATGTVTITQPALLIANCSGTNISCNGAANGSASVGVSGGTEFPSPTTVIYNFNDASLTNAGFNIGCPAGTKAYAGSLTGPDYGFSWTDALPLSSTITNINLESSFYLNCNGFTPRVVNLNGDSAGTINLLGTACSGCSSPASINSGNLNAGIASYTKGGLNTLKIVLNFVNFEGIIADTNWSNVDNIYARLHVTANTPGGGGYAYLWSNGATTASVNGLAPGTYTVTVTDGNGCTATCAYVVTEPAVLAVSGSASTVVCSESTTANVNITPSGGTTPYTYSWSNGATTEDLSGLSAGTYTVMVTDANGCTVSAAYSVNCTDNQAPFFGTATPGLINVQITSVGFADEVTWNLRNAANVIVLSGGPYGSGTNVTSASIPATGGPFTLNMFAGSNFDDNDATFTVRCNGNVVATGCVRGSFSGQSCGNINVGVISNIQGCQTLVSNCPSDIVVSNDAGVCGAVVNYSAPTAVDNCNVTVTSTHNSGDSFPVGTTTVTYTAADGCGNTTNCSFNVTVNDTEVPVISCPGNLVADCNGVATFTVTATDNCSATVTQNAGLPSGSTFPIGTTQIVWTASDASGNTVSCSFDVVRNDNISATANITAVLCNGNADGTIQAIPAGGDGTYTYLWDGGQTTQTITGLASGNYTVTVTDGLGCTGVATFTVTEPSVLTASTTANDANCNNAADGSAIGFGNGGTSPYSYLWSDGQTTQIAGGLDVGTYTVTVTDANGCTTTATAVINEPSALVVTDVVTHLNCFGDNSGAIDLTLTDGTPSFSFAWSNGSTDEDLTNLPASTYFVTITEGNGCTSVYTFTVTEPAKLGISIASTINPTSANLTAGSIDMLTTGGVLPYTYLWNNGATTEDISGLTAGTYIVTVTDANGCISQSTVTLVLQCIVSATNTIVQNASCSTNNGIATVNPSGGTGYTYQWLTSPVQTTATATGLSYGYNSYCIITDVASGCSIIDTVVVPHTTTINLAISSPVYAGGKNIRCNGESNGSISLVITGSTGPYNFTWSNGATTQNLIGLSAGTYTVTVNYGSCTNTTQITLTQPAALNASTVVTNASCGNNNGTATVTASGGTMPYTYSWNTLPVQTTAMATGLSAGAYTVTVGDANGCTRTATAVVVSSSNLTVTGTSTNITCNGLANGTATISISGGAGPFTYLWSNGLTSKNRGNLAVGTYTVTVTSAGGCTGTWSVNITQPPLLIGNAVKTNVSCFNGNDGTATVTASGGTPGYTYSWNSVPVQTTATATGLKKGNYSCTITDSKGCVRIVAVSISQPAKLLVSISKTNVTVFNGNNGTATANASGGTPGYTYSWSTSPVQTTQTATGLSALTYTVTVTDSKGCTVTGNVHITQPPARVMNQVTTDVYSTVYPNPTTGFATIAFDKITDNINLEIYSMAGELVYNNSYHADAQSQLFSLDLSHLPKGIYSMRYTTLDKQWVNKLVIK